jgi:hypothetical protein
VDDLVHAQRPGEVPHLLQAEVAQRRRLGQVVGHELVRGRRHQHLAAMGEGPEATGPVDGVADVVALVPQLGVAGVEGHANAELEVARPRLVGHRPLDGDGAAQGVVGPREGDHEAVALALLHRAHAVVAGHLLVEERIQPPHRCRHGRAVGLPQADGALEVGQQEGHRPDRQRRCRCCLLDQPHDRGLSHAPMVRALPAGNITRSGDVPGLSASPLTRST